MVRLPTIDIDSRSANGRVRGHAPLDRRGIDEWLERGARLAIRLHGVVEFVGEKIIAALHRDNLASLRIERHQRAFHRRHLLKFDAQTVILLVNFPNYELDEVAGLKFAAG